MTKSTFTVYIRSFVSALKHERWNYLLLAVALVLVSLMLIYQLFVSIYDVSSLIATSEQRINKIENLHTLRTNNSSITTTKINNWHLFGDAPILINTQNYTLVGIEYSDNDQAKVFLSANNGIPVIYHVGDKTPDGVIIQSIGLNEVTLLRDGTKQTLSLVWEGAGAGAISQPLAPLPLRGQ